MHHSVSYLELWRLVVSFAGAAIAAWGLWDAVLDALVIHGFRVDGFRVWGISGVVPDSVASAEQNRAEQLRPSALFACQRALGRGVMLGIQFVLSLAAILDGSSGADWKLVLQMVGVTALSLNAMSDRTERRLIVANQQREWSGLAHG